MKTYSLHTKSLQALFIPIVFAFISILAMSFNATRMAVYRMSDEQMVQIATTLYILTRHEAIEGEDIRQTLGGHAELLDALRDPKMAFRIWGKGQIITQSSNADQIGPISTNIGFYVRRVNRHDWRIYSLKSEDGTILVEIGQDQKIREQLIWDVIFSLIAPLMLFIPAVLLVIRFNLRSAIKPLLILSSEVNKRDANNLTPFYVSHVPREILPVFTALNDLIARINSSLEREREFTDNAAHELRTPLAALKTRAQVLQKQLKYPVSAKDSLDELMRIIDRNVKLVDQLLSFARIQSTTSCYEAFNFSRLIEDLCAETLTPDTLKAQSAQIDIEPDLTLWGDADSLRILARNLLQNAINYNSPEGRIEVSLHAVDTEVILSIKDTGKGIPDIHKEEVFERFKRFDSQTVGNGLGLSIVKWVADRHKAKLSLADNSPHGLIVSVRFRAG